MKQTEIGMIPDDWEVKSLGEISDLLTGYPFPGNEIKTDGTYRLLRGINITEGEIRHSEDIDRYYSGDISPLKKYLLKTNDLVIGMDGSKVGKNSAIISESNSNSLLVQRVARLREIKNLSSIEFISQFINSYFFSNYVDSLKTSSAIPHISPANIINFIVPFPPLVEQQRIAKALSDVDALISTTEKLIQKKKNIKQGAMQNLLTGKKRLPGFGDKQTDLFVPNGTHTKEVKDVSPEQIRLSAKMKQTELGEIPEDWEVKSLGESFDIGSSKRVFQSQWRKSGIPFYRAREIVILAEKNTVENELFIDETLYNQYKTLYGVPAVNDLLVTGVGTLGKVYKVQNTNPFYFKDGNIICLKNKGSINSDYVSYHFDYYIVKDQINDNSGKSTVGTYTINSARKTIIPVPSVPEQTAIANVLSSMDKEIETLNTNLEKYRNLKTAMMQQLLTGKIRLV